jgi:WD40 repeat protein
MEIMNRWLHWLGPILIACICVHFAIADDARSNPPYRELKGHTGSVLAVAFSHDEKMLVSGSRDSTIKIWDVETGQLKRTIKDHSSDVYCITFSHDGKLMASGDKDGKIILWDGETFEKKRTFSGHTDAVRDIAFSPDDQTIASAAEDKTFRLWNVATGQLKVTRSEHTKRLKTVVYYPDGSTIATASSDATIRLWDGHTGEPKQVLKGHSNGVEFCDVSPDGKQLFSGTGNIGEIIFWDAQTGEMMKKISNAHGNKFGAEIDSGHYSPDGKWAVSGSKDRTDKFWDPETFKVVHMIHENPGRTESMCFSPDGKTLATGFGGTDSTIRLWDLTAWMK